LFVSQIESLKVAFELIWKIAIFEFKDSAKAFSAERTSGARYLKKIEFTKNIDIINLIIKQNEEAYKSILYSWIMEESTNKQYEENEKDLISGLTLISEEAIYRLRLDENNELKFMNHGIYSAFVNGTEDEVDANDFKEKNGSLRILHSIISENLNPYLKKIGNNFALRDKTKIEDLKQYTKRVEKYLSLTNINLHVIYQDNKITEEMIKPAAKDIGFAYNRIIFGAPGTGKSYILEKQRVQFGPNFERVTFHPNYSYAQFVGTYKPKPKNREDGTEYVSYEFVAGPFLRMWAKATKNPNENYLLLVEEINRSNVAGVFGDVFQLLDRKADGFSEYAITTSEEMREYLVKEFDFAVPFVTDIRIPNNLYIWSTMNSADQGVFPMDTAFKRRWNFEYISIDEGKNEIQGIMITLTPYGEIEWDKLRTRINDRLTEADLNVNEDKLIGPFFISINELQSDKINEIFKSKLLIYLFEDVLKHRKGKLFSPQYNTLSKILRAYDEGEDIFDFEMETNSTSKEYDTETSVNHLKVAETPEKY